VRVARGAPLALLAVVACRRAPEPDRDEPLPVTVRCVPAARASVQVTETLRGRIAAPPGGDLPIASQVAGRVVDVLVHEGESVGAGALVALIDESASRDALRQADAALLQARAAEANAKATLERTRQLVGRGIAARQELDDAVARADQAAASVNAATAAADLARRTLGRVQVRSTFAGVVTRVWRGVGALVDGSPATPIAQLAAANLAEFDADATERELTDLAAGQPARVALSAGGGPLAGTVRARAPALDPATGLGLVRIAVDATAAPMLGAFGTATVDVATREALVIPAAAVRGATADGAEVALCAHGAAELRRVRVGWRDDARVEIVDGLAAGDRVAVDHVLGLETGSPIVEGPPP